MSINALYTELMLKNISTSQNLGMALVELWPTVMLCAEGRECPV